MAGEQGSNETENVPLRGWEAEARVRGGEEQVPSPAFMWLTSQSRELPNCLCLS